MADTQENIELLKKCDHKQSSSVLHRLVDGLCHRSRPTFDDYSKLWTLQEWWAFADTYTEMLKLAVKEAWTKDQLFQHLDCLSDEYRSVVHDVISSRRDDIRGQLLCDSHGISQAVLTDFDWKLKLAMSSDKISSVQEPLLSLDLGIQTNTGAQTRSIELNKTELDTLISSLEGANKALVQLKS